MIEAGADGSFDLSAVATAAPAAAEPKKEAGEEDEDSDRNARTCRRSARSTQTNRPNCTRMNPTPHNPVPGNGGRTDRFVWTQQLAEVSVSVPVPLGTRSRDLAVEIGKKRLRVGLKGQPPLVDGELHKPVLVDDSCWTLGVCWIW